MDYFRNSDVKYRYKLVCYKGGLVTTTGCILRLRMEKTATIYGQQLRVYCIGSRGQLTRCGPQAWALGEQPTNHHRTNNIPRIVQKALYLKRLFGTT